MNTLINKIETDVDQVKARLGIWEARLISTHASTVVGIITALDNVAKNPLVQGFLATVVPQRVMAHYPQMLVCLDKALATVTVATSIEADVNAAATTEAKLQIFIADLNKTNLVLQNAILKALGEQLLALVDNTTADKEVYALYLSLEKILAAPMAA